MREKNTNDSNFSSIQDLFCAPGLNSYVDTFLSALNILLSITAFLENFLVIVALKKVSSLHPPSKLLFRCLASSDLCVGLILEPLYAAYLMSSPLSPICSFASMLTSITSGFFCGVSLTTLTTISLDRLLALQLGLRYRRIVTLKRARFFVVFLWLSNGITAMMFNFSYFITVGIMCIVLFLCLIISTFSYTKIHITLRQHQSQVDDNAQGQGKFNGGKSPLNIARYRKTVVSVIWVQSTLSACYLPYRKEFVLFGITDQLYTQIPSISLVLNVTISSVVLNSVLTDLFLYCWRIRDVRQEVKCIIRQFCCFFSS